jgi:hypothetical protein
VIAARAVVGTALINVRREAAAAVGEAVVGAEVDHTAERHAQSPARSTCSAQVAIVVRDCADLQPH